MGTVTLIFKMSCPVNTFNKSKEDFIWFVKKAVNDQKSHSHSEMYHSLLKLFVAADTNKDGLVSRASFSKLIDAAAEMPRAYGFAPEDSDLYKTEAEKDASRQKMSASMEPHPIIDHGSVEEYKEFIKVAICPTPCPQQVELYWYMLEIFTDHDSDMDGIIKMAEFPAMMNELLAVPKKHNLPVPSEGEYETLFKKYDPRNDGRLTVDEWMSLATREVYKKF